MAIFIHWSINKHVGGGAIDANKNDLQKCRNVFFIIFCKSLFLCIIGSSLWMFISQCVKIADFPSLNLIYHFLHLCQLIWLARKGFHYISYWELKKLYSNLTGWFYKNHVSWNVLKSSQRKINKHVHNRIPKLWCHGNSVLCGWRVLSIEVKVMNCWNSIWNVSRSTHARGFIGRKSMNKVKLIMKNYWGVFLCNARIQIQL